ncbi:hypothetical protein IU443_17745 [Nocardia farcinica]|uniref:hypothetical protein n=1 Tax=Nocardia farcinica TaxID=37329 RepID=UPI000BF658EF|nr:hypothetical protein [Nocardia farcinica]MBF6250732.1 hypothetical protein [Nocardia farcinica]MBF6261863.1 hypothetical protein [Nocardia farcinica]MBF6280402.1 hypothetical protein [Nocardia farcinica]MBF6291746.1 hypothetical protein [Nocardia farcinica]MBF6305141.1 hypothetical protein [Nocardia farcinica]
MNALNGSSFDPRFGYWRRSAGHTDDVAACTVRQPTPYLACNARPDNPARASRRIAAYSSTFD